MGEPNPTRHRVSGENVVAVTSRSKVYNYYGWNEPPAGAKGHWRYIQTWAVSDGVLFGLHSYEACEDGGDPKVADYARIRFIFLPPDERENGFSGNVNRLHFCVRLIQSDGWQTGTVRGDEEPPQGISGAEYSNRCQPVLSKSVGTWRTGDRLRFGCVFATGAESLKRLTAFSSLAGDTLVCALADEGRSGRRARPR
jgi:hypothetical protein